MIPREVASAYQELDGAEIAEHDGGLINKTFMVGSPPRWVLQRLHPVFGARVHEDIEAVTRHLAASGLTTPLLARTRTGALWTEDAAGGVWRVMSFVPGRTVHRIGSPALATNAAGLVARFHRALSSLEHRFAFSRPGAHDTAAHLAKLERVRTMEVPGAGALRTLADQILAAATTLPALPPAPVRIIHGDLKISNVLFSNDRHDQAVCLIDLDTLAALTIPIELGDALRSWTNPLGEDVEATGFDESVFEAALAGYADAAGGLLTDAEVAGLVPAFETICLELAARFAADAFEDRYFGWNPSRFASRREHNRVRATGQLTLAAHVRAARARLEATAARLFRR